MSLVPSRIPAVLQGQCLNGARLKDGVPRHRRLVRIQAPLELEVGLAQSVVIKPDPVVDGAV